MKFVREQSNQNHKNWLVVILVYLCQIVGFVTHAAYAGETSLTLKSQGGDYVGQGQELFFTDADGTFRTYIESTSAVTIHFGTDSLPFQWTVQFWAPSNHPLAVGYYLDATGRGLPDSPFLKVSGEGRGCASVGAFLIKEISFESGHNLKSFWAVFEQHCDGGLPALFGEIRFNADTSVTVSAPNKKVAEVDHSLEFTVTAKVFDSGTAVITASGLPPGASFIDHRNNTGTFNWQPSSDQTGAFWVSFKAEDDRGKIDRAATLIAVGTLIRVPTDIATIQGAIDSALDGSRIVVGPGLYRENINFRGKWLTLTSEQGPDVTIIDGNQQDSVVAFEYGEDLDSVIDGFTIRNGKSYFNTQGYGSGGGIRVYYASATIRRNVITNNHACVGSGVSVESGSAVIERNIITGNSELEFCVGGFGGGIGVVHGPRVQIISNTISDNYVDGDGGGIALLYAITPMIRDNIISGNTASAVLTTLSRGGGISVLDASAAVITQNLIVGNRALWGGGVSWMLPMNQQLMLVNNTIAGNDGSLGSGIYASGFNSQASMFNNIVVGKAAQSTLYCDSIYGVALPVLKFNNVFNSSGGAYGGVCTDQTVADGNISNDPLFVDPLSLAYRLSPNSPSIDSGDTGAPHITALDLGGGPRVVDGNRDTNLRIDMGAYEFVSTAGAILFGDAAYKTSEEAGNAEIRVFRRGGSVGAVTVQFSTSDGTARHGTDYTSTSGTLSFADGETSKTITIPLSNDTVNEGDETIRLVLSDPSGSLTLAGPSSADLTIMENDLPLSVAINNVGVAEGNVGVREAVFAATLSAPSIESVAVSFTTADGTATAGSDYIAQSGTVTFSPGETMKNITILVNGDTVIEPDETLFVNLTSATNAIIAKGQGVGTIVNDDVALAVTRFHATASGFDIDFNKPFDVSVLNLYDIESQLLGPPDVTVNGTFSGPVRGSLVVDGDAGAITFVRTGGVLPADSYSVILRSGGDGFKDLDGNLLDGDGNGTTGDDYTARFFVVPDNAVVLSLPDFAYGPGQVVNVPYDRLGFPIVVSNGSALTAVEFKLVYDPAMLNISSFIPGNNLPAGATVSAALATPGEATIVAASTTAFGAGVLELGRLDASVPIGAAYKTTQLLWFEIVSVTPANTQIKTDDAVHVVAYLGDVTGNGAYSALDGQRVLRVAAGLDSGFTAYPLIDPVIIADVTGNGAISALDATWVLQEAVGRDRPEIPPIP